MEHERRGWRRSRKKDLSALAVRCTPPRLSKSTFSPELYNDLHLLSLTALADLGVYKGTFKRTF